MRVLLFSLLLLRCLPLALRAEVADTEDAAEKFKLGVVLQSVKCKADPQQSYALYLPSNYTADKKWPVLYAFSPGARGRDPVLLYQQAAEKFGWIVVGSNNSRNGPWEPIKAAVDAMWKDTHERFSIDDHQLYATGFSGGARVSCAVAVLFPDKPFRGWLPCGAGFSSHHRPEKGSKLAVCAMIGTNDFNYGEVLRMESELETLGLRRRVLVFEGRHQWPTRAYAMRTVRYMQLLYLCDQGLAAGKEAQGLLREELADLETMLDDRDQYYRGYLYMQETAELFKATTAAEGLQERLAVLKKTERFIKESAAEEAFAALRKKTDAIKDSEKQFREQVTSLRAFVETHRGTARASSVSMLLNDMPRNMAQAGALLLSRKDYPRAEIYLKRGLFLTPQSNTLTYDLACVHALSGRKDVALKTLAEAVKLGFNRAQHMKQDKDLASLRDEPAFKELVAKLESQTKK